MPSPGASTIASDVSISYSIITLEVGAINLVASNVGTLSEGTTYTYSVTAVKGEYESAPSAQSEITLSVGENSVDLSWTAVDGADSYNIYGRSSGNMVLLKSGVTETTYSDIGEDAEDINTTEPTSETPVNTQMSSSGTTVTSLASAMDTGWTCASPTTPSTFETAFSAEFSYLSAGGGGSGYLTCLAQALDAEVDLWVASWDTELGIHTYAPSASSIVSTAIGCSAAQSNAVDSFTQAVADTFVAYFVQEVG